MKHHDEIVTLPPNVSRETLADFETYADLLQQWQKHINLVANAELSNLWQRHLFDSAQLFPLAAEIKKSPFKNWLDVGSGGGFPGLVLAILIKHQGYGQIDLIESNGKKAAFLRMVAAKLHLPARIINQRIEATYDLITAPDIITARALAELPKLLALIAPFFGGQTVALLQKGQNHQQEIERAQRDWHFDIDLYSSLIDKDSTILAVYNLQRMVR